VPTVDRSCEKPQFSRTFGGHCKRSPQAPTAADAGSIVSVYVQISLSVTKVLIRKRF